MIARLRILSVLALMMVIGIHSLAVEPRVLILAQTIPANEPEPDSYFGQVVAVDGNTTVIAAPRTNSLAGNQTGAAYVYVKNGVNWQFQQKLLPSTLGAEDNFGAALAIDGDTIVVGAPIKNNNTGAVYVFTRSGSTWSAPVEILSPNTSQNDLFGSAVALAGDRLVVGAPAEGSGIFLIGAVYVYQKNGSNWVFDEKTDPAQGNLGDFFGASVALDGDQLLIGSPFKSNFTGAAYVFTNSGGTWSEQVTLTAQGGAAEDFFGWSVDLQGIQALIGAPQATGLSQTPNNVAGAGKAYAFTGSGATWAQQGSALTASDAGTDERFGWQVILNGTTAYISDDGADEVVGVGDRADVGAVYTFASNGTSWTQQAKLSPDEQFTDKEFGGSIALAGSSLFVGSPGTDQDAGEAYVYGDDTIATETPTSTGTLTLPTATATDLTNTAVPPTSTSDPAVTPTATTTAVATTPTPITTTDIVSPTPTATETTQPEVNLLVNGGFELQSDGQSQPDGWTAKNPVGDKRKCDKPGKDIAYEGECAYQFKGGAGENSALQQNPPITDLAAGDTLLLNGFVNASGTVNAKVKVRVTYVDTTLDKGKITVKIAAPTGDFTALSGTMTLTLADAPAAIKVQLQNKGTSGKARFDALSLLKDTAVALLPLP